jgi:nicotinamide-nucleotide amidase
MKAEIISIGTELLLGEITDTNASYLASQLPLLGIDLLWVTQVGDNMGRLRECIERALERSDIVLATGGLGPTDDDLTREAIAAVLGEELQVDAGLERTLRDFFASRNFPMPESNVKQAMLIPSAQAIPNPRGSAPGWWVEVQDTSCQEFEGVPHKNPPSPPFVKGDSGGLGLRGLKTNLPHIIIAMPGPPAEMQRMWEREVSPRLRETLGGEVIVSRTVKTLGMGEAAVGEAVRHLMLSSNPTLAVYAKTDGIHLRLTAKAKTEEEALDMIAGREVEVRGLLSGTVWGQDGDTLEGLVGALLTEKGLTLAVMESCTGGLLASTVTDVPGSSAYFKGGMVSYTNEAKIAYGVNAKLIADHGAISPEVAADMARAARERLRADIGVGVTGVAGPDELEGKPAGSAHIAIDDGRETRLFEGRYPPLRHQVKRRATYHALFELRRMLIATK